MSAERSMQMLNVDIGNAIQLKLRPALKEELQIQAFLRFQRQS